MIFFKEQKISMYFYVVTQKIFFTISLRILEIMFCHMLDSIEHICYRKKNCHCHVHGSCTGFNSLGWIFGTYFWTCKNPTSLSEIILPLVSTSNVTKNEFK